MASFNDPLFPGQWQLRPGTGINATPLYDEYSGRGVRIGLVDTPPPNPGLAELQGQIDWAASRVATGHNPADDGDLHGQSVALVLAARAGNGTGGIGAAFGATLVSYGFDSRAHRTVAQEAEMLAFQKEVDISQNSWSRSGESFRDDFSRDEYAAAAMAEAAAVGRGGLGTIFVRSAGNNGGTGDDVNTHSYSNNRWTVLVGATDAQGKVQGFSNPGAALLVVAPATATSYAAPLASATIALMLEANPALGYRDVQSILALSARMTDDGAGWAYNGAAGWNGGGLHVSRRAGFGLIDAQAAVRLAESWRAQSTVANLLSAEAAGEAGSTCRSRAAPARARGSTPPCWSSGRSSPWRSSMRGSAICASPWSRPPAPPACCCSGSASAPTPWRMARCASPSPARISWARRRPANGAW